MDTQQMAGSVPKSRKPRNRDQVPQRRSAGVPDQAHNLGDGYGNAPQGYPEQYYDHGGEQWDGQGNYAQGYQELQYYDHAGGHPVQGHYADGYAYPEAYNTVPEQQPNTYPQDQSLEPKRKPKRDRPLKKHPRDQYLPVATAGEISYPASGIDQSTLPSTAGYDVNEDARSRTSQGSGRSGTRSKSSDPEGSGSGRGRKGNDSTRSSREYLQQEGSDIARDGGSNRSKSSQYRGNTRGPESGRGTKTIPPNPNLNPNPVQPIPLNEYLEKTGGRKPNPRPDVSMVVFDSRDRPMPDMPPISENPKPQPAYRPREAPNRPPSASNNPLNEWVKQHNPGGGRIEQDMSMIVYDDHDKNTLFLGQAQPAPYGNNPINQPAGVRPRRPQPGVRPYDPVSDGPQAVIPKGAIQQYNNPIIQPAEPNAKCMACVHGIGVPVAKVATRILVRQCMGGCCCCTIL